MEERERQLTRELQAHAHPDVGMLTEPAMKPNMKPVWIRLAHRRWALRAFGERWLASWVT